MERHGKRVYLGLAADVQDLSGSGEGNRLTGCAVGASYAKKLFVNSRLA